MHSLQIAIVKQVEHSFIIKKVVSIDFCSLFSLVSAFRKEKKQNAVWDFSRLFSIISNIHKHIKYRMNHEIKQLVLNFKFQLH